MGDYLVGIGEPVAPYPCLACGKLIVYPGRGRRRKFCSACTPPGSSGAAWRAANPERVAASNEARRLPSSPRRCPECGEMFKGRPNKLLCGLRRCRDARYKRLHPAAYAAKRARKDRRRRERKGSAPTPPVAPAPPRDVLGRNLDARRAQLVQRAEMIAVSDGEGGDVALEHVYGEIEWIGQLYRELLLEAKLDAITKRWL